jgi:multiple sugar transport system substrate-binding protein
MKKKVISTMMAAAMATSLFTVPVFAEETTDEPVTITYWGWDSNYYQPMMDAYTELHPNVTFEATATEWGDMLTKAQQALASGSDLPTIIPMDITLIANWKQLGITENLLDYGLDTSVYNQALIDAATNDDGELIGLFENVCPSGIAYKRDLALEYFGTDDPDELSEIFNSYEAYVEKGKEVAEASDGSVYLFHSGQAVAEWLYFASDIANVTDDTINMTDKMTDVMSKLIELRDAGAVDSYQSGTAEANATYADDTHIFYPCPDWALTYYIEGNDPDGSGNWGLIKAPVDYSHGGTAMGISSTATDEQKAAAYDFITWAISSEEGATVAKDEAGYITQDTTIATEDFCKRSDEDFFGGEDISALYYQDIASNISIAAPSAYDNDIVSVRNDVAQQVMNDSSVTLDDAVAAAIEELGQLVTDENVTIK